MTDDSPLLESIALSVVRIEERQKAHIREHELEAEALNLARSNDQERSRRFVQMSMVAAALLGGAIGHLIK